MRRGAAASLITLLATYDGLPLAITEIIALYVTINLAYSFGLKQVPILELLLVASGIILRLIAGGMVIGSQLRAWILVCTGTLALLLVTLKRHGGLAQNHDPTVLVLGDRVTRFHVLGWTLAFIALIYI